jgi:hypothetical protein
MINPDHSYAVYEYNERVTDKYYVGRRFISSNPGPGEPAPLTCDIIATADTTEELQQYLDHSPKAMRDWLLHQREQLLRVFGPPQEITKQDRELLDSIFNHDEKALQAVFNHE